MIHFERLVNCLNYAIHLAQDEGWFEIFHTPEESLVVLSARELYCPTQTEGLWLQEASSVP